MRDEERRRLERYANATGDEQAKARVSRNDERSGSVLNFGRPLHGLVLVIGSRGSGKTTKLQQIVRDYSRAGHSFVVCDRYGHWRDAPRVLVLRGVEDEKCAQVAIKRAPCTLVLDEIDVAIPAGRAIDGALREIIHNGRQAKAFQPWARMGPVALIGSARIPMNLRTDLRKQVDYWFLGKVKDPRDEDSEGDELETLEWYRKNFGRNLAEKLTTLQWGQFVEKDTT